ncbi:MAG TPA: peptidoglycan recognition family protein, partial [Pirellulales bacterium]|nr:peptidoglycan recognition family protein [Pirellulales bacterium]
MLRALGVVMMNATIGCFSGNSAVVPPPMYGAAAGGQTDLTPAEADHADVVYPVDPPPRAATATFVSLPASWQPKAPPRPWKYIVLHHTATEEGDIETIDQEHRQRKDAQGNPWLGIGYHFVVGNGHGMADGLVEPSFRWTDQIHGAHAGNRLYNEQGIGICLVGNFVEGRPTDRQITATRELVRRLSREFAIAPDCVLRHQDIGATECPGPNFPLEEIVGRGRAPRAPDRQPPVGALDAL